MASGKFILKSPRVAVADSLEAIERLTYGRGWTDGLPIIPPTEERVQAMLAHVEGDPQEVIGIIPPRYGKATMENIAINAVMAGCLPEDLPVVVAAVRAICEPSFNLYGVQATTHAVAPLLVVNGPIAKKLDINSGYNVFGQGWRANATIGRAVRLVMQNTGGARPGGLDRATQGQPGKYSFCIAENEEQSPWEPFHVERGFKLEDSTVTVIGAGGTFDINDRASTRAQGVLTTLAGSMKGLGGNNYLTGGEPVLALCPEHAATIAKDGLSKNEVKRYLFEKTKIPASEFPPEFYRDAMEPILGDPNFIPLAQKPENILIVVAGGPGHHSTFIPTAGIHATITKKVEDL